MLRFRIELSLSLLLRACLRGDGWYRGHREPIRHARANKGCIYPGIRIHGVVHVVALIVVVSNTFLHRARSSRSISDDR